MNLTNLQVLIDENVPFGLKKLFHNNNIVCTSVQKLGWNGYKDIEIAEKLSDTTQILITRDKDFQFLWERYHLRVTHLMIEPATLNYIFPVVKNLLDHWNFDPSSPFLIIVQNDSIRFRNKKE